MTSGMNSMRTIRHSVIAAVIAMAVMFVPGCGLKDDLYLPAEDAAAPANAAATGADSGVDNEKDPAPADPTRDAE